MAVSEDGEGDPDQNNTNRSPIHGDVASINDNLDGPCNGGHPVPSSDYYAGELPENMNVDNLCTQTVVGSIGELVTSNCGANALDVISSVTARRQASSLTLVPQRYAHQDVRGMEGISFKNTVSSEGASCRTDSTQTTGDNDSYVTDSTPLISNLPLSLDSFEDVRGSESPLSIVSASNHKEKRGFDSGGQDSYLASRCAQLQSAVAEGLSQHNSHVAERSFGSEGQIETSGYRSNDDGHMFKFKTSRQFVANLKSPSSSGPADDGVLQLSETGINAIKNECGTKRNPLYPRYSTLPMRLISFPHGFRLGEDTVVNRDLLALAGFFYSEHGTVTCFHCGCSPRVWGNGRDPKTEHRMLSPYCRALPFQRD